MKRSAHWLALAVAAVLYTITMLYWWHIEGEHHEKSQISFERAADRFAGALSSRLTHFETLLRGLSGLYESSDHVSPQEFRSYVKNLNFQETYPGLQGLGLVTEVAAADKPRHEAEMQQAGLANYRIHPPGHRPLYRPITLIEPLEGANLQALGFDTSTVPPAAEAMALARDMDRMAITAGMQLIQDGQQSRQTSFVMYLPVYARGAEVRTVQDRQTHLVGWVEAAFRLRDLVATVSQQMDPDIQIEILDHSAPEGAQLLYQDEPAQISGSSDGHGATQTQRRLNVGERRWTVSFKALPAFEQRFDDHNQLLLFAGLAASSLMSYLVWLLATGRERASKQAHDMTREVRAARDELEGLLQAVPDPLFELSLDGRYHRYWSPRMDLLAAPPEVFLGKQVTDILPPEAAAICLAALKEAHEQGHSTGKVMSLTIDHQTKWFELSVSRKQEQPGIEPRFVVLSRDITGRKLAETQLRLSAQVFESSREGIMITDEKTRLISVNPMFTTITGYSAAEVLGQRPTILSSGQQNRSFYDGMWKDILEQGHWEGEILNQRKNGEIYPQWLVITPVKNQQGQVLQYIGSMSDLTTHKANQARIDYLAHHDPLTRLPNRLMLQQQVRQDLGKVPGGFAHAALLFIDLDRFKNINESLGHAVGDSVLQAVATRLSQLKGVDDMVCRPGGDEFMIWLPDADELLAAQVARRMMKAITEPIRLEYNTLTLSASIGIALFPEHGSTIEKLSQCADAALFEAKNAGRDNFQFFAAQLQSQAQEVLLIENHLRRALELGELRLHYQPQIDAHTGVLIGLEALVRWQHPQWGMVSPARFIPIAEETGQIREIGDWVLRTATQQLADWKAAGLQVLPVAVNLSALEFRQPDLCEKVASALRAAGLAPELLELELTESVAMENSGFAIERIDSLHAMGVALSIDDFGTGYSSLSYLKRFKVGKLKIDQSFVRDLENDSDDRAIILAIISMARSLGFKTIAEGVETQGQYDFLRNSHCDEIQGYYFSKPLPPEQVLKHLRTATV
ncbi:MAG: hypothetical protein RJA34_1677 [Pseudomonadota bacterium]